MRDARAIDEKSLSIGQLAETFLGADDADIVQSELVEHLQHDLFVKLWLMLQQDESGPKCLCPSQTFSSLVQIIGVKRQNK